MKPKERRDRLFKTSRRNIREMALLDQQGYTKDMSILWGAYMQGSFDMPETSQEEFAHVMTREINPYQKKWIVEDKNAQFKDGYGPVGMMVAEYNGWELEPQFVNFSWSSPRNTLRAVVSFLQMMRYDKSVGIVNVHSLKKDKSFFNHVSQYGVLKYAAKIPDGSEKGDKYVYYIRGRK